MADKKEIKKVVLAYSGGLDTSIIIPWLKENYNDPEIIAVSGNVGQADELEGLEERAIKTGASKLIVADLTDEMVDDVIIPSVKAGAKYETYLLGTAFARPVIAKKLTEIALAEGADAICHGCTGKGNDQVRFELAIKRFAPGMKIIAPWREWDIVSRDQEIDYAEAHNVPLKITRERTRTCGTCPTRVWIWKIPQTNPITTSPASWKWASPPSKRPISPPTSPSTLNRARPWPWMA